MHFLVLILITIFFCFALSIFLLFGVVSLLQFLSYLLKEPSKPIILASYKSQAEMMLVDWVFGVISDRASDNIFRKCNKGGSEGIYSIKYNYFFYKMDNNTPYICESPVTIPACLRSEFGRKISKIISEIQRVEKLSP